MTINWLEWIGYLASLLVLISLLMSSIIKLRWINLLGSCIFALYGFLIGALPVGFMNTCICLINIYYLTKIYRSKEFFKLLNIEDNSSYFVDFLEYYKKDIKEYTSFNFSDINNYVVRFFVLRNQVHTGIFLASRFDEKTLLIELDFVTPEYRDFKIGSFIFDSQKSFFLDKGYSQFLCSATNPKHVNYLKRMGFETATDKNYFSKPIR
ncbi:MAG: hypothetical protein K0R50_4245 [Eubacterium sp.]|jgi:hypothetical protein|nr:hypothetical protein [Eubacterium sp.]